MMSDDPTPRELLIQLQALAAQVASAVARIDELTRLLGTTYVPRGEYEADRRATDRRFAELEKDNENAGGFRRQVLASLAVGLVLLLISLVLSLVGAMPRAGS